MLEETKSDKQCDGYCPRMLRQWYCCAGCVNSRRAFYDAAPPEIQKLWSPQTGFWDPQHGCRLAPTQRPPECRQYDCADQVFVMGSARDSRGWPMVIRELPRATADEAQFLEAARRVWLELHERAVLGGPRDQGTDEGRPLSSWDQALEQKDGPTVYLLQGLLGSGKSTWAKRFTQQHRRCLVVSGDGFRSMLAGQYEYREELDDLITLSMCNAVRNALSEGYDVLVDVGNLTAERREPWLKVAADYQARLVAVVMPRMHKDWHVGRRVDQPHWNQVDWGGIYDREVAALEPIEDEVTIGKVIHVPVQEVSGRRILILTASPVRDQHIDRLLADKLMALGHDVEIAPCQRGGRDAALRFRPDIVLVPPIRNPNSADMANELKRFGCAVVTRHTEPSCSWQDWKKMTPKSRNEILGMFPYNVDLELVWSPDEADILNRRTVPFKAIAIGAVGLDIYFDEALGKRLTNRPAFYAKHELDPGKPTLLISSPWGFADSSPDLGTDEILEAQKDAAGRDRHLAMVRAIHPLLKGMWNLVMTVHPGVGAQPYVAVAQELGIPIDVENPMLDLLRNCDALIHAGSTAAVSAHLLGIPAFQYGDVNAEGSASWWGVGESAISRVSPMAKTPEELAALVQSALVPEVSLASNANLATIKELEEGRYGVIDGHATDRAIPYIVQLVGQFRYRWPRAPRDYQQPTVQRSEADFLQKATCSVCGESFVFWSEEYLQRVAKVAGVDPQKLRPQNSVVCPHCAARMFRT